MSLQLQLSYRLGVGVRHLCVSRKPLNRENELDHLVYICPVDGLKKAPCMQQAQSWGHSSPSHSLCRLM